MAFDPNTEDYQRLGVRWLITHAGQSPWNDPELAKKFAKKYVEKRDSLPQTDEDRAFHLVALAANLIDYELPFSDDRRARELIEKGHVLLDEALSLDPKCHDARRMREAAKVPSFDGFYDFLASGAEEVRQDCEAKCAAISREHGQTEGAKLAVHLAMRPYYRWLANQAERAIICGRNRQALGICKKLFELDAYDLVDARFTAALAYAKLEDRIGFDELVKKFAERGNNAWYMLARTALYFKSGPRDKALDQLKKIIATYPHAVATLTLQRELPDGVFARLAVPEHSEDALVLAVSEGTVLLQEGRDRDGRGAFGKWVQDATTELAPQEAAAAIAEAKRIEQEWQRFYSGEGESPAGGFADGFDAGFDGGFGDDLGEGPGKGGEK